MNKYDKMRDALMQVSLSCSACPRHNCKGCTRPFASFMPTVRKALSLPRRNCDVGTPEEQDKRWRCNCGHGIPRCCKCAVYAEAKKLGLVKNRYLMSCDCKFIWAQMPYEEADGEIK